MDYIGVHSAHALRKWQQTLPGEPLLWQELSEWQQRSYLDFITIAACELSVDSIDASKFMALGGKELDEFVEAVDQTLLHAHQQVASLT